MSQKVKFKTKNGHLTELVQVLNGMSKTDIKKAYGSVVLPNELERMYKYSKTQETASK